MADLGLAAYRFSVSWPRVTPQATADALGPVNPAGLDFYPTLVDELLAAGIKPVGHALPLGPAAGARGRRRLARPRHRRALRRVRGRRRGGARRPGGRLDTLNEPWCSAFLGYGCGVHAPGPHRRRRRAHAPRTTSTSRTASRARRDPRGRARGAGGPSRSTWRGAPGDRLGRRRRRRPPHRRPAEPGLPRPDPATAATPPTCWPTPPRVTDWSFVQAGDLAAIAAPHRRARRQLLHAHATCGTGRASGPARAPTATATAAPGPWLACDDVEFPRQPGAQRTAMGWPVDPRGLTELLLRAGRPAPRAAS